MLKRLLPALALLAASCTVTDARTLPETAETMATNPKLTIERLYASPDLSGPKPREVKYSPDGQRVTFLKARGDDAHRFDLWQFDVATGAQSMLVDSKILEPEEVELSEEEKALRERKRIAGSKGIVSYDWGTSDTILVPIGGDLHLVTLGADGPHTKQLTETDAFEYDAKVSPNGRYVSFIRDGALYAIELASGEETRLTPLAESDKALAYGVAEFVAQEEMDRYTGYWWGSGRYIAYTRVDESSVDVIPRFEIAAEDVTVINQRYPRAGRPNAIVDLFVRNMETGEVVEIDWRRDDWGPATDQYLARARWTDGDRLSFDLVNRDQTNISTRTASVSNSWKTHDGPEESQTRWVNLSDDFRALGGDRFLTTVESNQVPMHSSVTGPDGKVYRSYNPPSNYRHIVTTLGDGPGHMAVTSGEWAVSAIEGVDEASSVVYFTGYKDTPLEKHLYVASYLDPSEPHRVTELGKSWAITMSVDGGSFVGTSSSPDQPPQTGLYKADGSLIAWIEENALDESHPYAPYLTEHTTPEYGTLKAEDGQTLYYSIQKPPGFDASKKYPVLVEVYGGPGVQTVTRNWERMSDQFYSRQGYIVFRLDNRGSANRGKKFEDVIYRRTGGPEVRDQLVGVEWLKSQPFVDESRIGIQGWSYGGYMTLMTILQAPEGTFAAAVSGAPVTDWSLYDTFYTERYMGTPENNPEGYEASSVFPYLDNLTTPLLLIHGMADDNVTFDNSTRLYAELQKLGKSFEMMTYPGQRHGIRGEALQVHLMKTRMAFWDRQLKADAE